MGDTSTHAYQRLKHLYEISKELTRFAEVDESFPKILSLVAGTFPILSAVLVEDRGSSTHAVIWPTTGLSKDQVQTLITKANASFSYFMKSTPAEKADLQSKSYTVASDTWGGMVSRTDESEQDSLIFPLSVGRDSVFGVVLFEGLHPLNEEDVSFASALSNLLAVALDRVHKVQLEKDAKEAEKNEISADRDNIKQFAKQLEEERELREMFIHTLTHDLRTPLSTASMSSQLLARSKSISADDLELVGRIKASTKRLGQMIDRLLDASRIKAGESLPLDITECDFDQAVDETKAELESRAEGRIQFKCSEAPIHGHWDCEALRRMTENLVGNAIKYGDPGTPILIQLRKTETGPMLSVHNEGNPIPQEDQGTLFNQFSRTKSAQRGGKQGWGLGLTLVQGIADAHGGKAWVESGKTEGTTFFVQIPYDSRPFQDSMS